MTTRYITEAEKAGVKRRMAALRKRKMEDGLRQYVFWLSADDAKKVKEYIEELEKNLEDSKS
jgi:coenzyme F420-reducing hydrogenase delta subunit